MNRSNLTRHPSPTLSKNKKKTEKPSDNRFCLMFQTPTRDAPVSCRRQHRDNSTHDSRSRPPHSRRGDGGGGGGGGGLPPSPPWHASHASPRGSLLRGRVVLEKDGGDMREGRARGRVLPPAQEHKLVCRVPRQNQPKHDRGAQQREEGARRVWVSQVRVFLQYLDRLCRMESFSHSPKQRKRRSKARIRCRDGLHTSLQYTRHNKN